MGNHHGYSGFKASSHKRAAYGISEPGGRRVRPRRRPQAQLGDLNSNSATGYMFPIPPKISGWNLGPRNPDRSGMMRGAIGIASPSSSDRPLGEPENAKPCAGLPIPTQPNNVASEAVEGERADDRQSTTPKAGA